MDKENARAVVETGIPVPKVRDRKRFLILDELEVGQSAFLPNIMRSGVSPALEYRESRDAGKKFTCRKEGTGVRVWRLA